MKNYKSLAAAAAAVVLIVSSITGCSAAQAAANVRPAAETTQETASAQEKEDRNKPGDQLLALVNEGKLSQETYDAIQKYLEANRQEPPEGQDGKKGPASAPADGGRMPQERPAQGADGKNPAERPADEAGGAAGKNPPEKPAGEAGGAAGKNPPEKQAGDAGRTGMDNGPLGMMISRDTLDKLLSGGVITQAEYDLIKEVIPEMPEMPEMPTEAKQF